MYNARFKHGIPSLKECESLEIKGDVFFEGNVTIKGQVVIQNQTRRPAIVKKGTVIDQDLQF